MDEFSISATVLDDQSNMDALTSINIDPAICDLLVKILTHT